MQIEKLENIAEHSIFSKFNQLQFVKVLACLTQLMQLKLIGRVAERSHFGGSGSRTPKTGGSGSYDVHGSGSTILKNMGHKFFPAIFKLKQKINGAEGNKSETGNYM